MIFAGTKKKDTRLSIILALLFNMLVLLLVYSFKWKIPDPPPADSTVELSMADFGYTDTGSGNTEGTPVTNSTPADSAPEEAIVDNTSDINTQVQETPSSNNQPTQTQTETQETQETQQQTSSQLNNAIANMNSGGDGPQNDGGNVGVENGKIEGKGVFGDGSGWSMTGRSLTGEPRFNGTPSKNGKVQVRITIGKDGKVRTAKVVHAPPTNTSEQSLFNLAIAAAKTAKFNADSGAKINQSGTITFVFKVN